MRQLIPKMREIFTNMLRNVSASIIARDKRCLVKYTILTIARELKWKNYHKYIFAFVFVREAFGSVKTSNFVFKNLARI